MTEESRTCPFCGKTSLKHPYWTHVQQKHPEEYKKKQTWIQLYKDYRAMGMDPEICFTVISELFNATADDVRYFLKENKVLD